MSRYSLRFDWTGEGTHGPPDLGEVPRDFFDLRREWQVPEDTPRRSRLRLEHVPAIVFAVVLVLTLADEAARQLKALGVADDLSAGATEELHAIQTARDGMACLAGAGPCPGGRHSPF